MSEPATKVKTHSQRAMIQGDVSLPQPTVSTWQAINWIADRSVVTRCPVLFSKRFDFPGGWSGFIKSERSLILELARGRLAASGYSARRTVRALVGFGQLVTIPQQVFTDTGVGIWWTGEVSNRLVRGDQLARGELRPSYNGPFFVELQLMTDDVLRCWPAKTLPSEDPAEAHIVTASPKRGPKSLIRPRVETAMKSDIAAGTLSALTLSRMLEKELETRYDASRFTVRGARKNVLSETPTNSDK